MAFLLRFSPVVLELPEAGTEGRAAKSRAPSSGLEGFEDEYRRW